MRIYIFYILFFVFFHCKSQTLSRNCINALEYINAGYIQYGVEELKKVATTNSIHAQYFMAVCYENGIGVQQDAVEAFKMCRRAAERGLPDAMFRMAVYYKNGGAVATDESKSQEWYKRFQAKGGNLTLPDICLIYNEGITHPENYALNPNGSSGTQDEGNLLAQNNGNINSNNQVVNNITIVQTPTTQPVVQAPVAPQPTQPAKPKSDVDSNIPTNSQNNENTFALIIANENYQDVAKVPNAQHDGEVFAEYCAKTLGMPQGNIHLVKDATLNNMKRELNLMNQIAAAYNGKANFIIYYAGHGVPDEVTKNAYLLPVDGYGSDLSTCYNLSELYTNLGKMAAAKVVVLLDACFSGSQRGDGMLASARGVAIKAKTGVPTGNMVVLSAAQNDETAYSYEEQGHGLFTYYLLKKLQETKGNASLGDLSNYIKENVVKKSLVANGKQQTPSASASATLNGNWQNLKLN